jgi:hypothetical protein
MDVGGRRKKAMSTAFTRTQQGELRRRQVSLQEAQRQIDLLRSGVLPLRLLRPGTAEDGVIQLSRDQESQLEQEGRIVVKAGRLTRFVPASGAASRMFAQLASVDADEPREGTAEALHSWNAAANDLPFTLTDGSLSEVRRLLYGAGGLAKLPKGLVAFHRYARGSRSALEEHLVKAAVTGDGDVDTARVHFTIPSASADRFITVIAEAIPAIRRRFGCTLQVDLSSQNPSTDTLALDEEGHAACIRGGSLLFRPGGHGALLGNIGALSADLVLIRNIDNIAVESAMASTARWHRVLTGFLSHTQSEAFAILSSIHQHPSEESVVAGETFLLSILRIHAGAGRLDDRAAFVTRMLDRPWRVCGMVRNDGEPGGGPFWVADDDGTERIQIVESAQIHPTDESQRRIWSSSTHFNPVHLLCGMRDWRGRSFDLDAFAARSQAFVASKDHQGRALKVLEHPGLWNGSMAGWNTLMVEVPSETFSPVKTVFDLLRPMHQTSMREAA